MSFIRDVDKVEDLRADIEESMDIVSIVCPPRRIFHVVYPSLVLKTISPITYM